jgi:uncharacterized repeat protein (TIGR03987 family)
MIIFSVIFILLALCFYTVAVWTEKIKKHLEKWIVYTFASGFMCDLIGTSVMFYLAKDRFSMHPLCGYLALIIMLLHLIWAIFASRNKKYEIYFTRFSIFAWCVWLVAFFSGIPN